MKNVFAIAILFLSTLGFSQSNKEEVELFQSLYGMDKKEVVAHFVTVDASQKDAFWKIYDEYEVERKAIGKEKYSLLEKYAQHYGTMDAETMDDIMNDMIALTNKTDKLQATYYGKVKKAAGVKAASQFLQLEYYLSAAIRAAILEEIPFIGELDK
ncbi:MAG TPA: hypothetical protein VN763_09270 [Saprospiraceae bacterium]|nr:hypothetical protein [Saprospiraceae bacterium]